VTSSSRRGDRALTVGPDEYIEKLLATLPRANCNEIIKGKDGRIVST